MITKEELNVLANEFNEVQKDLAESIAKSDEISTKLEAFEEFKTLSNKYKEKATALTKALKDLGSEIEAKS